MTDKHMKMGYVAVETIKTCSLFPAGQSARGHIYHFSEILEVCALCSCKAGCQPCVAVMCHAAG